jgi:hypothetical protein
MAQHQRIRKSTFPLESRVYLCPRNVRGPHRNAVLTVSPCL